MFRAGETRLRAWPAAVAMVVLGVALFLPGGASARPRPVVSLSFASANEGEKIPFTWSARHLGGAQLVLQRPVGTAHVWKTVGRTDVRRGTAYMAAGLHLGQYRYRMAAIWRGWVVAQQVATASVFGQVPFSTLLRNSYLDGGHLENGSYATSTTSFPYVGYAYPGEEGRQSTLVSDNHNHCSAVHVGFVLGESPGEGYIHPNLVFATTSLVQQSRDPVATEVPLNGLGSLDAELIPGQTWSLVAASTNREAHENTGSIYFNGYAICDSAEPFGS